MASAEVDENDLKDVDHMIFSSKLHSTSNVGAGYEHVDENLYKREEWVDLKNSHSSCLDDDFKSISQEPFSRLSSMDAVSNNVCQPAVTLSRMSSESDVDKDDTADGFGNQEAPTQITEYVYLNRLPGENLGMVLGIEGDQENRLTIDAVVVKSVTPIGAVARSCQGTNRILVGDEIREIDGQPLNQLTHNECIALFQEMPDNVVLTIFRKDKHSESCEESSISLPMPKAVKRKGVPTAHTRKKHVYSEACTINQEEHIAEVSEFNSRFSEVSHSGGKRQADFNDYNLPKGFTKVDVTICRRDGDNFGLSVVPSFGATCDLYQIKRLVHSGASAQSGLLEVGDRLLACNDQSLKGLTQSQCLNVLKSSGALIKLTVLRPISSKEDPHLTVDSVSPRIHQTLSPSSSNDSTDIIITQEGSCKLSRNTQEALTENETVNDTQFQENISISNIASENSSCIDNVDNIQVLDTKATISTERSVREEKNGLHSINIPPPGEFSDADSLHDTEFLENRTDINVTAANVDDLLFGTLSNTPSSGSEAYCDLLGGTHSETDSRVSVLTFLDQKSDYSPSCITLNASYTDSTDGSFTGGSIEEFANECFSNISDTEFEKASSYPPEQSSENGAAVKNGLLHIEDDKETCEFSNLADRVTTSLCASSNDYDFNLPLSDLLEFESHSFSECNNVQMSSDFDTRHAYNTNSLENLQPGVSKSHVDGLSEKPFIKEETLSPAVNIEHHSNGDISNTLEGISSLTQTPSTESVDESSPVLAGVNSHLYNASVRTSVGVTTMFESREQEEDMEHTIITDNEGTLPSILSQKPIDKPADESSILDIENKPEIAGIHSTITTASANLICPVTTNGEIKRDFSEEDRVSTLQTVKEKESVLDVLKSWASEISSNNAAALPITVSGSLDTHRKAYEQSLPENAVVHTTVGVSNTGQEENVIQPMTSAKDNQGRQFYIPSFSSEQTNVGMHTPDHRATLEIAKVISSLVSLQPSVSRSEQRAEHSRDHVREDVIVPTVLSYDENRIVANVLDAWVNNNDRSGQASTFQRAVTGFKIHQKQANAASASSYSEKLFEANIVNEHNNDKQSNNADRHASTKDKEVSRMLISTENNASINEIENIAKKSAEDFVESCDIKLRSNQPEVKVRSDLDTSDNNSTEPSTHQISDHVILRKKLRQSTDLSAQADKIEQSTEASSAYITRRPRSMIVTSSNAVSTFEDLRKSATDESKHVPAFRPLSALRPLSASTASMLHHSSTSLNRPTSRNFSSSTFATKVSKSDYPKVRQADGSPFQVDVIKGIVGLGLKVKVTPEGSVQVTEVTRGGSVDKDGQIHIGDNILSINSTELAGQTDARVQQILRLLPRGLTKLVVSSGLPASAESQSRIVGSSCNSSVLTTQSYMADTLQSSPSLNNDSLQVTLSQRKSHSSKTDNTFPSQVVNTYIKTANSLLGASEDHVSEKIELISNSSKKFVPAVNLDDTSPAVSPKHDHFATVVPKQDLPHIANETQAGVSKNLTLNKSEDSFELQVLNAEPIALKRQSSKNDESIVCKHQADFKSDAELLKQDNLTEHTESSSPLVAHPELLCDIGPVANNNQDASIIYSSLSNRDLSLSQDFDRADIKIQDRAASISDETNDYIKHPPKVPPPVAPKPRLSPAPVKRTEDSVDASQPIWPPLRKTVGDDKLHDDHKLSKSAVGDKASSFVSLTAKMFDDKTTSSNPIVNKTVITRQVSREMVAHTDSSKAINTSLLPTHDRHTNTLSKSSVSLSQPSTLSRPRTLNYIAAASKEVPTEEDFTKIRENVDHKTNSVLSPTQLNAALSPRRKPSFDYPTSPPINTLNKHVPEVKDDSLRRVDSGKGKINHQFGIYQTTPLALLTDKSPSLVLSKDKHSPHPDQDLHTAASEHHIRPLVSPSSLSIKEDAFKQFENLLLDDELSTETLETSQTVGSAKLSDTHIADVKKPVALPRRKVEHKPSELKVGNKDSEELSLIKFKEGIDQTQNKLEEDKALNHQFDVDNSNSVNIASGIRDFPEERSTINITDKISEYNGTSFKNISIETTEITEVSVTTKNEIKQASNISEIDTNVHETNNKTTVDSTDNHQLSLQRDLRLIDTNLLKEQQFHESNQPEEGTIDHEETSERFQLQSLTSHINSVVNDYKTDEGFEANSNEAPPEYLEAYAHHIVEQLMKKIVDNPGALSKEDYTNIAEISNSKGPFEEEPHPFPDKELPVPASPLRNTDLLINADDFMNQADFPAVKEDVTNCLDAKIQSESMSVKERYSVANPAKPDVYKNNESLVVITQPKVNEENKTVIVESVRQLNFGSSNVYSPDAIDVTLTSPLDLLSEDSGMPADEDQDVATDDAISPPSELVQIGSHVVKKVPFSLTNDDELLPMSSSTQECDNLMTDSASSSKISTGDLLGNVTFDSYNKGFSENGVYHENAGPLLPTTSTSTRVIASHSSTNYAEDLLSNNYSFPIHTSVSPQLPSEVTLLWDDISAHGNVGKAHQVPVDEVTPETKHYLPTQYQDSTTTASILLSDASFQDTDLLKPVDIPSVAVASKRMWCLTSHRTRSTLLSGDPYVPVDLNYKETTLLKSLSPDHLRSVIMKANAVLDAVSAPDSLLLIVVHVHSSDDCAPLVFDIGHKGSIWFQVSGIREKRNLLEGDGIEDGDWLIMVADEWCDQATIARFQYKLVNWTHNQLLVFARGRVDINVKEAVPTRPLPTPRSRSLEKQYAGQKIISKAEYEDVIDAAPHYDESIHSEKLTSLAEKASLIPDQAQHLLDEELELLNNAPTLLDEAPPLPDEAPPLPDEAPPLPDEAPPLPDVAPPLFDQAPLLPGLKTPTPNQTRSLLDQTPSLIDQTILVPDKVPPIDHDLTLLKQMEQLSDKKSSFLEQAPSIPDRELPQFQHPEFHSYQRSSLVEQTQTILDPEQPLLKRKELPSDQQSDNQISDQAASSPGPVSRLLDKVIVKESLPFLDDKNKTLPDKTSWVVNETQKMLARPHHSTGEEDKVTAAKYNINGGQEASSSAEVKSSPDKTPPAKEDLPAVKSRSSVSSPGKTPHTKEDLPAVKSRSSVSSPDKTPHTKEDLPAVKSRSSVSSPDKTPQTKEDLPAVKSRSSVSSPDELVSGIHKVTMMKGATGVGFCIEGGVGSPKGDMPIIIKRIFKGGPAEKCGQLKVRDEILEVNGVKFHSMRHFEAWNHLKFLDDGAVNITLRRPSS